MAALSTTEIFEFDRFRLDRRGLFRRDGDAALAPVEIGSRALDVLRLLLERPGDLVSRDEIMAAAWPGIAVEDNNLTIQIASLRRVLDQGRANGSCIQTVPRRGYRLVAPVTPVTAAVATETAALPQSVARPRSHLSIVVLPFANLTGDPDQQYLADGITEDVTTDLSRIVGMLVISRNTAFTYRNKPVDTRQIGRELRVRYVLEGSVQRSGNQVRVATQLIDAESDAHLWAERFEHERADLFAMQNEITGKIAYTLGVELVAAEAARPTDNLDAMDCVLRGRAQTLKPPSREMFAEMISQFERAVALDPYSVQAHCWLITALMGRVHNEMSDSADADIKRAEDLVNQMLATSPRNPHVRFARAFVLRSQNRIAEAIPEYEAAIASNRNWLLAIAALGWCKFLTGSLEEGIPLHQQAIRLSPRDSLIGVWYERIGAIHLLQSRIDEAIVWLEKARNANPVHPQPHRWLASAYALKGHIESATAELSAARRLAIDDRHSSIARLKASGYFGVPKVRALFEATYFAGLRKAGMPEE